jgi:hypothetical protein
LRDLPRLTVPQPGDTQTWYWTSTFQRTAALSPQYLTHPTSLPETTATQDRQTESLYL